MKNEKKNENESCISCNESQFYLVSSAYFCIVARNKWDIEPITKIFRIDSYSSLSLRCNWYSVRRTHKHSDQTVYCLLNKLILLKSIINVSNKCVISHIWSAKGAHGWMCDTLPPGSNINRYGISHEFPCSRVWNAKSPGLLHTDTCTREHCIIIILTGRPIQPRHCVISIYGAAQWHSIIEIIRMKISYSTNFVFMHRGTGVLQCKLCVVPAAICCVCSMLVLSMENGENEEYGEKYTQEWVRSRKVKRFVYDFHINRHSTWCVVENCSSSEPNGKMLRWHWKRW